VYPTGVDAELLHVSDEGETFTRFVKAKPVPVSCTMHFDVIGQSFVIVSGPFSVKTPTSKE
jgi:hypothetical protein